MTAIGGAATGRRRAITRALGVLAALLLVACTMPPVATPTLRPSPSPTSTPLPTPTPTVAASPSPTPSPTPDLGAIPDFAAGEIVSSLIDGLRVRQRPGVDAQIATGLLPLSADLEIVMGPFVVDDFGWYLVTDADSADPAFEEGWVAAGYEPDPFLRATGSAAVDAPYLLAMAGSGDAEEGPTELDGDDDHFIRWIARDPEGVGCRFAVSLVPPQQGEPVPAIRATVGSGIDRGTLQPQTLAALGVTGTLFVQVASDCTWSLVVQRVPDDVAPSPSPSAP